MTTRGGATSTTVSAPPPAAAAAARRYPTSDLERALGHPPLPVKEWLRVAAQAFTPSAAEAAAAANAAAAADVEAAAAAAEAEAARAKAEAEGGGEAADSVGELGGGPSGGEAPQAARPRQPTVVVSEMMEDVWEQVTLLESEGKYAEAAERQADALLQAKGLYDDARLKLDAYEAASGVTPPESPVSLPA